MKHTILLLATFLFFSCSTDNKNTADTDKIADLKKDSLKKQYCQLKTDTFSFKGIRLGEHIDRLSGKYKLREEKKNQLTKYNKNYSVVNPTQYTIFGSTIDNIEIATFLDKIYEININVKQRDIFANNISSVIDNLASKFDLYNCIENEDKEYHESLTKKHLFASNDKIQITASMSWFPKESKPVPIKEGQSLADVDPEESEYTGHFTFTDVICKNKIDKLLTNENTVKEKANKKDF